MKSFFEARGNLPLRFLITYAASSTVSLNTYVNSYPHPPRWKKYATVCCHQSQPRVDLDSSMVNMVYKGAPRDPDLRIRFWLKEMTREKGQVRYYGNFGCNYGTRIRCTAKERVHWLASLKFY